jgi:hypothetical protein
MVKGAAVFALSLLVFSLGLAGAYPTLTTKLDINAYQSVAQAALSNPALQQLLGSGNNLILFNIGTDQIYVSVTGTAINSVGASNPGGSPSIIVTATRDAVLTLVNAVDKAATLECLLSKGYISIYSPDFSKELEIKAALSSGLISSTCPLEGGAGSTITIAGEKVTVTDYFGLLKGVLPTESSPYVFNTLGGIVGFLPPTGDKYSVPPVTFKPPVIVKGKLTLQIPSAGGVGNNGLFFDHPPGVLAQNPGLIYDTCTQSNNCIGPQNIFQKEPGLIGPNQILKENPGLIGPADMALIDNNLYGPAEFAYAMGIGAYSNAAHALENKGQVKFNQLGNTNRWGHNP